MASGSSARKKFQWKFLKSLPGIFVNLEMGLSGMSFFLSSAKSLVYQAPEAFYIIASFCAFGTSIFWYLIHFCGVTQTKLLKKINWRYATLIYTGIFILFMLIASVCYLDSAFITRTERAAGVFGYLTTACFLVHFIYELKKYVKESGFEGFGGFMTSMVKEGNMPDRDSEDESSKDDDPEDPIDSGVVGSFKVQNNPSYKEEEGWASPTLETVTYPKEEWEKKEKEDSDDSSIGSDEHQYNFSIRKADN